ncbi:MAG TPA: hypothetical protein VGK39_03250 [Cyclobacteriaceae bacterium]
MKKLIYALCQAICIVLLATSCSNDDNPPPKLLLTSITSDGLPLVELTYDSERKLRKVDYYDEDGALTGYVLYEYNEDDIQELLRYNEDHDLVVRSVFTLDNAGRVIKTEDYTAFSDFENVTSTTIFTYDPSGRLKSKAFGTFFYPEYTFEEFTYDNKGRLIKSLVTAYPNQPLEYTSVQTDFTPRKKMYAHWADYVFLLALSDLDLYVKELFNNTTHEKTWDEDGEIESEYDTDATDKQFNSDGYLIKQFLTRKSLLETEPDVVREMTYEYTE